MRLIRSSIFETNSSSTNSLDIDMDATLIIPESLKLVEIGGSRDFEFNDSDSKFSILAHFCRDLDEFLYLCYKVQSFGVKNIILFNSETLSNPSDLNYGGWFWCDMSDSEDELRLCFEDDDVLKHWLFSSDSYISGCDDEYDSSY